MELISARKTSHKQQPRSESPSVTLTWHASNYIGTLTSPEVHKRHQRYILEHVPLVEFICTLNLLACQVRVTVGDSTFVVVFAWRLRARALIDSLNWLLILHRRSRPHPTSDCAVRLMRSATTTALTDYWITLKHRALVSHQLWQSPGQTENLHYTIELNAVWCAAGAGPPNSLERDVTTE